MKFIACRGKIKPNSPVPPRCAVSPVVFNQSEGYGFFFSNPNNISAVSRISVLKYQKKYCREPFQSVNATVDVACNNWGQDEEVTLQIGRETHCFSLRLKLGISYSCRIPFLDSKNKLLLQYQRQLALRSHRTF